MGVETLGHENWNLLKGVAKFPLRSLDQDFMAET